jgi:hypothetical protein
VMARGFVRCARQRMRQPGVFGCAESVSRASDLFAPFGPAVELDDAHELEARAGMNDAEVREDERAEGRLADPERRRCSGELLMDRVRRCC